MQRLFKKSHYVFQLAEDFNNNNNILDSIISKPQLVSKSDFCRYKRLKILVVYLPLLRKEDSQTRRMPYGDMQWLAV